MKNLLYIAIGIFTISSANAQLKSGLTGVHDSSYTVQHELAKHIKKYPAIQLVNPSIQAICKIEKGILYNTTPEQELRLDVYQPLATKARKKTHTAIIFIHGGGWRSGDREMHAALLEQLAAKGYVCISPSYRLSTVALYPAAIYDIKSAIRWTRAHAKYYHINPDQIVIAGHSAGGELAAFMASTNGNPVFEGNGSNPEQSSKVNALIDLDGTLAFIHPESGEGADSGNKISAATYWFGYTKNERPDIWNDASPLSHAGCSNVPTLFINSSVDRMHAGRTDFIHILDTCGIYSAVKTFENAPHTFCFFEPWFTPTISEINLFIKQVFAVRKKKKNT